MNIEKLKEKTAYNSMPQVWQRGFNVAVREMQAELAALKAAQEWRGIESAPKDGTWVLVIDSEYGDHGGAFVARYTEAFSGSWLINTSHIPHIVYPTHWQPLPTPPQEQSHD
jgi:hypothetical protein